MRKKPAACISAIDSSGTLRSARVRTARDFRTGTRALARSMSSEASGVAAEVGWARAACLVATLMNFAFRASYDYIISELRSSLISYNTQIINKAPDSKPRVVSDGGLFTWLYCRRDPRSGGLDRVRHYGRRDDAHACAA